jgi:hypothetical protein
MRNETIHFSCLVVFVMESEIIVSRVNPEFLSSSFGMQYPFIIYEEIWAYTILEDTHWISNQSDEYHETIGR